MSKKILIIVGSVAIIMFSVVFFIINGNSNDNNTDYVSKEDSDQIVETSPLENIDSENNKEVQEKGEDIVEQEALQNVSEQEAVEDNVNYSNYAQYVQNIQRPSGSNVGKTNTLSTKKPSTPSKEETNAPSAGESNKPNTEKPSIPNKEETNTPSIEKPSVPSTGESNTPSTPEVEDPVIPDTEAPSVTISKNSSNGVVKSVEVQITATDDREVDEIRYYVGKTEGNDYQIIKGDSATISLDNNLQDGVYYIWYYAVDTSGNVSDIKKSGAYELDNTVPNVEQEILTDYVNYVSLNDDGNILFGIKDYILESDVVVKYSVVGVQEENTEFKEAVYYIDPWWGDEGFKTTDTYSEGNYKISLGLFDTAGNVIYVIDSKIMYLFN